MELYDFLIAVIAHRPEYRNGFFKNEIQERILERYDTHKEFFSKMGVPPHHQQGDSLRLEPALTALIQNCVVKIWTDGVCSWAFPDNPKKYYNQNIALKLNEEERDELLGIISEMYR